MLLLLLLLLLLEGDGKVRAMTTDLPPGHYGSWASLAEAWHRHPLWHAFTR